MSPRNGLLCLACAVGLLFSSSHTLAQGETLSPKDNRLPQKNSSAGSAPNLKEAPASASADFWAGRHVFDEDGGKTPTDIPIYVAHVLDIEQRNGKLVASLKSEGFQISRQVTGEAVIEGDRLHILFQKDDPDASPSGFTEKDLLFTLERIKRGGRWEILTHWDKLKGSLRAWPSGRVYFRKESASMK